LPAKRRQKDTRFATVKSDQLTVSDAALTGQRIKLFKRNNVAGQCPGEPE